MATPNNPPAAGKLLNPAAINECRRRGWPLTAAALADAAALSGLELHIAATDDAAREGIAAIAAHQQKVADRAAGAAVIAKLAKIAP